LQPIAVGLVLGAALLHAVWNRSLHATPDRDAALAVSGIAGALILLPATVLAFPREAVGLVLLSAAAETVYALALAASYRRGELAHVYPLARGTAPALVTLGGWAALRERPDLTSLCGAISLGLGLALLADSGRRSEQLPAIGFALLAGIAIACYSVVDAAAVRKVSPLGYIGAMHVLLAISLTGRLGFDVRRLRRSVGVGTWIGIGGVAAYLLVLFAFRLSPAGEVATLRETSVLLVVLLSPRRHDRRVWAAAALVAAGAGLAAL
jgi:drug/metabolite transporter (DMT)-like permease